VSNPTRGDWVQRRDDKRIGRVIAVGSPEAPAWVSGFRESLTNEVVVEMRRGSTIVCTAGPYFWTKWERLDAAALAQVALTMAHDPSAEVGDG
jgi:hypothetical protein